SIPPPTALELRRTVLNTRRKGGWCRRLAEAAEGTRKSVGRRALHPSSARSAHPLPHAPRGKTTNRCSNSLHWPACRPERSAGVSPASNLGVRSTKPLPPRQPPHPTPAQPNTALAGPPKLRE